MVLAIGIVVDDAIVVVENVERHIEEGLSPLDASHRAMEEVSGPIIAIALVLSAVFIPVAFISGLTGQFYRQFALTIAFSTLISAFNSLTLSPALAAVLLRPRGAVEDRPTRVINRLFGWVFRPFNRAFSRASGKYGSFVRRVSRRTGIALAVYGGLVMLGIVGFKRVPAGFVPPQDKRYLVAIAQLPDAASLDRTESVIRRMTDIALKQDGIEHAVEFPGLSISAFANKPNAGVIFLGLKPERPSRQIARFLGELETAGLPAYAFANARDGRAKRVLHRRCFIGGLDDRLQEKQTLLGRAYQTPTLAGQFSSFQVNVPQIFADVDRDKVKQLDIRLNDLFQTLQIYLGSQYVNDFNKFGRTYQVIAQADAPFRSSADDISQFKVRNGHGEMVPLGSVLTVRPSHGPDQVTHYNGYPAADINGSPAPGVSSGEAVQTMERLATETLPNGFGFEWTELTYQQKLAGTDFQQ